MPTNEDTARRTTRAAREVAHAASYLASEAASLARVFEGYQALDESANASKAAVRAAHSAFDLDELVLTSSSAPSGADPILVALDHARRALDAATDSIEAARAAVAKANAAAGYGAESGLGAS